MTQVHLGEFQPFRSRKIEETGMPGLAAGTRQGSRNRFAVDIVPDAGKPDGDLLFSNRLGNIAVIIGAFQYPGREGIVVEHPPGVLVHRLIEIFAGGGGQLCLVDKVLRTDKQMHIHLAKGPRAGPWLAEERGEGIIVQPNDPLLEGFVKLSEKNVRFIWRHLTILKRYSMRIYTKLLLREGSVKVL